jgi:hypothetical protein
VVSKGVVLVEAGGERLECLAGRYAVAGPGLPLRGGEGDAVAGTAALTATAAPPPSPAAAVPVLTEIDVPPPTDEPVYAWRAEELAPFRLEVRHRDPQRRDQVLPKPFGAVTYEPDGFAEIAHESHPADGRPALAMRNLALQSLVLHTYKPLELAPDSGYQLVIVYRTTGKGRLAVKVSLDGTGSETLSCRRDETGWRTLVCAFRTDARRDVGIVLLNRAIGTEHPVHIAELRLHRVP